MSQDDLDNLLRSHLAGELDRQRGRTLHAFRRQVIEPMQANEGAQAQRYRLSPRRWAAVGLATAACVAIGVALPSFLDRSDTIRNVAVEDAPTKLLKPIDATMTRMERTEYLQNVDHGPAFLGQGNPARRIRQQRIERYRWTDPQTNAQYEFTRPTEQELLVETHRQ